MFWSVLCFWLAIAFATESMGLFAHSFNSAAAVVLLLCGALFYPAADRNGEGRRAAPLGVAAFLVGLLLLPTAPALRGFAAGLALWGLDIRAGKRRAPGPAQALAFGAVGFGLYSYLTQHSLLGWYTARSVDGLLSSIGTSGEHVIIAGATFNGLPILVLGLVSIAWLLITPGARSRWVGAAAIIVVLVIEMVYLRSFAALHPDPMLALRGSMTMGQQVQHALVPVYMPAVLSMALGLVVAAALSVRRGGGSTHAEGSANDERSYRWTPLVGAVVMTVLAVMLLVNGAGQTRSGKGTGGKLRFALYKEGFHNWLTPNKQRFGARSAGMFGNLPILLRCMGWEGIRDAEILASGMPGEIDGGLVKTLDAQTLADIDLLFLANPKDSLPAETIREIERFVLDGGSLLVLGDHTWRKDDTPGMILDEPLGPTHIRFNFDSAYYFIGGWLHSMQYWPHPTTARLGDETNESGCVVGASLKLSYPATPLVIGRYGYADRGHEQKDPRRGYMDNGMSDPGEPLGDLVLVAAENVGHGRVVVVGDTSGFVNAIQTQTWGFTARLLNWLGTDGRASVAPWRDVAAVLLLCGVGVVLVIYTGRERLVLPTVCVGMLAAGWAARTTLVSAAQIAPLRGNVAYIDLSHVGRYSLEAWRKDAVSGVYLNLMRNGYLALGGKSFDAEQVRASEVFVTVAPTKPYAAGELNVLEDYMQDGGTVLITVGWEEKAGAQTLLDRFGIAIPHRPHGRATEPIPGTRITPNFWEAWPVESADASAGALETLASLRGEPIIVRKTIGRGQLVVIGDSKIFFCQNLETEDGAIMPNVQFFNWLVENVLRRQTT